MKHILISAIAILMFSCCSQMSDKEKIEIFENHIGKENARLLTEKVEFLEKCFKIHDKGLTTEESYKNYVGWIESLGNRLWKIDWKKYDSLNNTILNSPLGKEIWMTKDSVWIDGEMQKTKYVYRGEDGSIISSFVDVETYDPSIDKNWEERPSVCWCNDFKPFNKDGKYLEALNLVSKNDTILQDYLGVKDGNYGISPGYLAGYFLSGKVDYSNYFVKRIIVVEMF